MIFIMVLILIFLITRKVSLITGSSFTCVSDLSYKMSVFFGLFLLDASFSSYQLVEFLYIFYGEGNSTPLQYSCLENPMDGGVWWAAVHGVVNLATFLPSAFGLNDSGRKAMLLCFGYVCAQLLSHVWHFATPWTIAQPGFSVHGISQARILEWVAISYSRGSSQPRNWTRVSCIGRWIHYHRATWEAYFYFPFLFFLFVCFDWSIT